MWQLRRPFACFSGQQTASSRLQELHEGWVHEHHFLLMFCYTLGVCRGGYRAGWNTTKLETTLALKHHYTQYCWQEPRGNLNQLCFLKILLCQLVMFLICFLNFWAIWTFGSPKSQGLPWPKSLVCVTLDNEEISFRDLDWYQIKLRHLKIVPRLLIDYKIRRR